MYEAFNSTFISLIPKTDCPESFNNFQPIAVYNCIYKIIAKIIANRLRPILSAHISPKKFAFLNNCQIHDVIGTTQGVLHSIKVKRLKGMILKVDLSKYFDHASWLYLIMLLTHLGFPVEFINWIMCCITKVSFIVLINGSASPLFHAERRLIQGFPLSPLLFLLIMEGLSRLISEECRLGRIQGIKITNAYTLTHLLFVDDVLLFLNGSIGDMIDIYSIMLIFSTATGMESNDSKSTISTSGFSPHEIHFTLHIFPFTLKSMDDGLKYLGFHLKPLHYRIVDWIWLVEKIECKINIWHHKSLSRVSCLVLIKFVLEATPVYWMSLAWIPRGILMRIQKLCCGFPWKGRHDGRIYAWVHWELIALPNKWGGWGLKILTHFSTTLAAKLGWKVLTAHSLWTEVVLHKYIYPLRILDWIRLPSWNRTDISVIWKDVLNSISYIYDGLTW